MLSRHGSISRNLGKSSEQDGLTTFKPRRSLRLVLSDTPGSYDDLLSPFSSSNSNSKKETKRDWFPIRLPRIPLSAAQDEPSYSPSSNYSTPQGNKSLTHSFSQDPTRFSQSQSRFPNMSTTPKASGESSPSFMYPRSKFSVGGLRKSLFNAAKEVQHPKPRDVLRDESSLEVRFNSVEEEEAFEQHLEDGIKRIEYLKKNWTNLLKLKIPERKQIRTMCASKINTIVLDLAKTTVLFSDSPKGADLRMEVGECGRRVTKYIRFRPHLAEFIDRVSAHYEFIIYSDDSPALVKAFASLFDPSGKIFYAVLDATDCIKVKGKEGNILVKDLCVFMNRILGRMIAVDDDIALYPFHFGHVYPIAPWNGDPEDKELRYLGDYLLQASKAPDFKAFHSEHVPQILRRYVNENH
eukprot:TRINITY_DN1633_c0_g1_i1.p1 TRINITY_DN1633_c0_g1~~TRINITY_DN1633_c0_g1_i1.p1  ORF type:complete len:409 (-),score=56.48 TRINITY_DN1633_c0_g1_i1:33-1259(-)